MNKIAQIAALALLTHLAAAVTVLVLGFLVGYVLIRGVPNLNADMFSLAYTSDNQSMLPAILNTCTMTLLALLAAVPFGMRKKAELDEIVEKSLRDAAIWDELKDRLKKSALGLSGGQQQRLCIARALAVKPEVILMDEPTSALDPISTSKIEDLVMDIKKDYTIVMVTHNMQQAVRVSDTTVFFLLGEIVESGATGQMFSMPKDKRTEDYITGRFG